MTAAVILVIAVAILFGLSPGLTLIAIALAVLAIDHFDPRVLGMLSGASDQGSAQREVSR